MVVDGCGGDCVSVSEQWLDCPVMLDKFDRGSAVGSLAGLGLERKEISALGEGKGIHFRNEIENDYTGE